MSVDEAMVKFKGHLGIEQYMLLKRGLKVWVLAKASSGFVCNFHVYTGKRHDGTAEQNFVQTWNLVGKNHHVIFDNFFSTVKFVEDLLDLEDSMYSWETKRANRKDFSMELAANNPNVKHLRRGEALFHQKNVVAIAWKDKKQFILRAPKAIYLEMGQLT